jgi:hypothetical protein
MVPLILKIGAICGWADITPTPFDHLRCEQETGWTPEPVWASLSRDKSLASAKIRTLLIQNYESFVKIGSASIIYIRVNCCLHSASVPSFTQKPSR